MNKMLHMTVKVCFDIKGRPISYDDVSRFQLHDLKMTKNYFLMINF